MRIHLSLSRVNAGRLRRVGAGLAVATGALALAAALQAAHAWRLAAPPTPAPPTASGPAGVSPEARRALAAGVAYLNRLLEAEAVSWTGRLAELEAALPPAAALTELRPDGPGRLRLAGVAASVADVEAFVRRLEGSLAVESVFLLQQTEMAGRERAFSVAVSYRSPG